MTTTMLIPADSMIAKQGQRQQWRRQYRWCVGAAVFARANGDCYGARVLEAKAEMLLEKMSTYR